MRRSRSPNCHGSAAVAVMAWGLGLLISGIGLVASPAGASQSDEQKLAEKFAPVVRLVNHPEACGPGEPFRPSDVDLLMGNDSVALRGPWTTNDLIAVGPSARRLSRGLDGYALDYPGDPLKPGCSYEQWADRTFAGSPTTVYAHVATAPEEPGRLALQYWFFYPFNDFNNKHEGDWEVIQLDFDARDANAALDSQPVDAVYSAHEGSERAAWGDSKLQLVDGTHPEVYVSAGSHANHFSSDLFLLRSKTQGLGCDNTIDTRALTSVVKTIPSDATQAVAEYPWLAYQGHWGQKEARAFYTGPTGPAMKDKWSDPFAWTAHSSERSYPVPGGSVHGVKTTDFFCGVVGSGSLVLLRFTSNPIPTLLVLAAVVAVAAWLIRRTSWKASRPWPVTAPRGIGQTIAVAWAAFRSRPLLFLGIGGVVALVSLITGTVGQLVAEPPGAAQGGVAELHGAAAAAALVSSLALSLALLFQQAATAAALGELDASRPVGVRRAYGLALGRALPLLVTALIWTVVMLALIATLWLAVLAVPLVIGWSVYVMVVQLDGRSGVRALRRSWQLVRRQFFKVTVLLIFAGALTSLLGGLLGTGLLLLAQTPFILVNLVPGVVAALLGPFTSLCLTYAYFHGLAREREGSEGVAATAPSPASTWTGPPAP